MSLRIEPVKATTLTAITVWLTALIWVIRGYVWPTLSNVEVAALQAMIDPGLFHGDFAVRASLGFTPRFYWNELILLLTRCGLPLAASFACWQLVALGALLAALWQAAISLRLGGVAFGVLTTWVLFVGIGTIGAVYFYTHAPVPAVWAGAALAWAAVLAGRKRLVAAYACVALAVLLQFLVGLYGGILLAFTLRHAAGGTRWRALAVWALALAAVYLPMRWSGGTSAGVVDDRTFVTIYAFLRLPHHLVPTSWGWAAWIQFTLFYVGAAYFLFRTRDARWELEKPLLQWIYGVTVAALLVNYLGVEWHPVAIIAKLQPARITPLVQLVVLALLVTRLENALARRAGLEAAVIGIIPFTVCPGLLLGAAAILLAKPAGDRPSRLGLGILTVATVIALDPTTLPARLFHYAGHVGIFVTALIAAWLAPRPRCLRIGAVAAVLLALACAWLALTPQWPPALAVRFAPDARPAADDAIGRLGQRFGRMAARDAVVLVPPAGETWRFKLFSRRADVVDDKNMPFTDAGMLEWRSRMEEVLGARLTPGLDTDQAWSARSPEALETVARRYHAAYVLSRDNWHPALPGRRIDSEQGWTLWQLP